MRTDNQIVNAMNVVKDIVLFVIFSMVVWGNKSNIEEMVISKTDNEFLALSFSISIFVVILFIFFLIRIVLHKLVFKIFGDEDN
ncbi:hypothetical protein QI229_13280 [Staphylococcus saprophyticus]|uniref:hypothetical protein n=1 Tax=Staphylococcus TaxID=1279 RepID=UPI000E6A3759|nr:MULTISPECIES: hypothetical protein [Staphylococcus]MBF7018232.1 hypothetical protein [Staphylococcus durrellii]MDW4130289.1 hypothetical protein [Staphylococcus saprophyticus]RIL38381.1 hypothetical protein BUY84_08820 [Staphylococcus equorum]